MGRARQRDRFSNLLGMLLYRSGFKKRLRARQRFELSFTASCYGEGLGFGREIEKCPALTRRGLWPNRVCSCQLSGDCSARTGNREDQSVAPDSSRTDAPGALCNGSQADRHGRRRNRRAPGVLDFWGLPPKSLFWPLQLPGPSRRYPRLP